MSMSDGGRSSMEGSTSCSEESEHAPFEELYSLGKVLGVGGFGEVRYAVNRASGLEVAVKIVRLPDGRRGTKQLSMIKAEVSILNQLKHRTPHLMQLIEVYRMGRIFYLVTEFCGGGEVLSALLEKAYTEEEARQAMRCICIGVSHLHSMQICHRDLKLENILLVKGSRTNIKIADFGLAVNVRRDEPLNSVSGSILYVAPEILRCKDDEYASYDERVDIWSMGVALYILLSAQAPFDAPGNTSLLIRKIKGGVVNFNLPCFHNVSDEVKDLILRMLTVSPDERITVDEILEHPWFAYERACEETLRGGAATDTLAKKMSACGL